MSKPLGEIDDLLAPLDRIERAGERSERSEELRDAGAPVGVVAPLVGPREVAHVLHGDVCFSAADLRLVLPDFAHSFGTRVVSCRGSGDFSVTLTNPSVSTAEAS